MVVTQIAFIYESTTNSHARSYAKSYWQKHVSSLMFNVKIFVLHIGKIGLCTFICVPPINFLLIITNVKCKNVIINKHMINNKHQICIRRFLFDLMHIRIKAGLERVIPSHVQAYRVRCEEWPFNQCHVSPITLTRPCLSPASVWQTCRRCFTIF